MKLLRIFSFLLIATITLTTSSCGKAQLDQLEATWEYINFDDLENKQYIYTWIFNAGEITVNRYDLTAQFPVPEPVNSGFYNTNTGFTNASIEIYDLADDRQNVIFEATWEIADIGDNVLRLDTKDIGGHVIREFKRFE
ncbi:MAG: hypothetical protein ACI9YU_000730 [Flavobacteriales bacterium]|jgi:hypothetical protein